MMKLTLVVFAILVLHDCYGRYYDEKPPPALRRHPARFPFDENTREEFEPENDADEEHDDEEDLNNDALPRAKPWRWLRRVNIGCTIACAKYNWCRIRSKPKCSKPESCNCNKFSWEE